MSDIDLVVMDDCALIMVTAQAEESDEFRNALQQVLAKGFSRVEEEYFDRELDRYVYVFVALEDQ